MDFDQADILNNIGASLIQRAESLRTRTVFGFGATFKTRTTLAFDGFYDGIGTSNFEFFSVNQDLGFTFELLNVCKRIDSKMRLKRHCSCNSNAGL